MAGVGLVDLKRRIKSVISTQKITKAMGLVATVKFKTARVNIERYRPYYEKYCSSVDMILSSSGVSNKIYCLSRESGKDMYIIITSDSGLCGSYNTNVMNLVIDETKNKKDEVILITVGQKGKNFFESRGFNIEASFTGINVNPSYKETSRIVEHGIECFVKGEVKNVYIVFTKFISPVNQVAEIKKLLPISPHEETENDYVLYEPSAGSVIDYIIPKYLQAVMHDAVVNSIASEYAMRMNSMDSATKNASEILGKLQTVYNRVRQANITNEITEIVGGAEALKE